MITKGDQIVKYCDISEQLNALKQMRELATEWDTKYNELR